MDPPREVITSLDVGRDESSPHSDGGERLKYDFYSASCPSAERIIRSTVRELHATNNAVSQARFPGLLHWGGGHSTDFFGHRLFNFKRTKEPDHSIDPEFLETLRSECSHPSSSPSSFEKIER